MEPDPYVTADGRVGIAYRLTEADLADISMANDMYAASPDGRAAYQRFMDSLPDGTLTLRSRWDVVD